MVRPNKVRNGKQCRVRSAPRFVVISSNFTQILLVVLPACIPMVFFEIWYLYGGYIHRLWQIDDSGNAWIAGNTYSSLDGHVNAGGVKGRSGSKFQDIAVMIFAIFLDQDQPWRNCLIFLANLKNPIGGHFCLFYQNTQTFGSLIMTVKSSDLVVLPETILAWGL